jgi:hypothetical protein
MGSLDNYPFLKAALDDTQLVSELTGRGIGTPRHIVSLLHDALEFTLYECLLAIDRDIYRNGQNTIGLDAAVSLCKARGRGPPRAGPWWPSTICPRAARPWSRGSTCASSCATCSSRSAAAHYRDAMTLAVELGMSPLVAHCHLGLGKLHRRTGRHDQAHEHLITATTIYRAMDMRFWLEQADAEVRGPA